MYDQNKLKIQFVTNLKLKNLYVTKIIYKTIYYKHQT